MWSYIIDGALILTLVICVIIGIARGFFDSVLSLIGTGLALTLSVFLAKHVANFFNKIFNFEDFVLGKLDESGSEVTIFGSTLSNVEVAKFCVWLCSVVILFLAVKFLIFILAKLFASVVKNSPTVSGINRVLGLVFGLTRGAVIVIIALALCSAISDVPKLGTPVYEKIQDTAITSKVFDFVDDFVEKNLTEDKIKDLIDKIITDNKVPEDTGASEGTGETSGEVTTTPNY